MFCFVVFCWCSRLVLAIAAATTTTGKRQLSSDRPILLSKPQRNGEHRYSSSQSWSKFYCLVG